MKKIGILYHPKVEATLAKAKELEEAVSARGISVWLCSAWEREEACKLLEGTDLLLTVGGDGTILRAAQATVPQMTPIAGVNLGKLGFMTEMDAEEALEKLPLLLDGGGWLDERAMLQVEISGGERGSKDFYALNDVVVARGMIARVIQIGLDVDGQRITTYRADGLIVSTATGSTGYALAAGGPVMYPGSTDIMVIPVAAHLNRVPPVILPGSSLIELYVSTYHSSTISIDGHINLPLVNREVITVRQSPYKARFLRIRSRNSFFGDLEGKLKGIQSGPGRKS